MATRKIPNVDNSPDASKVTIEFDNGDLEAMETVKTEWRFVDEASLLRFALAVLKRAKNKRVYVDDELGNKAPLSPGVQLILPPESQSSNTTLTP